MLCFVVVFYIDLLQVKLLQSEALNIYSHLYLRVLSPPGPCQALTINYNNQTIWILKLSLFLTIQLVPIPRPPTAYKALDTSVLAQKGSPQTLHSSIPPRLLLPGIFSSSPPPCWLAGWLRVGGPPSSGGHGSGLAVGVDVVVGQQVKIFGWATNLVDMLLVVML